MDSTLVDIRNKKNLNTWTMINSLRLSLNNFLVSKKIKSAQGALVHNVKIEAGAHLVLLTPSIESEE